LKRLACSLSVITQLKPANERSLSGLAPMVAVER
jgi:hypothetical protein